MSSHLISFPWHFSLASLICIPCIHPLKSVSRVVHNSLARFMAFANAMQCQFWGEGRQWEQSALIFPTALALLGSWDALCKLQMWNALTSSAWSTDWPVQGAQPSGLPVFFLPPTERARCVWQEVLWRPQRVIWQTRQKHMQFGRW